MEKKDQKKEYLSERYDTSWIEYLKLNELFDLLSHLRKINRNNPCPIASKIERAVNFANKQVSELEILSELEINPNYLTCKYVLQNPNAPAQAVENIYKNKNHSWRLLFEIAKHSNTGSQTLQKLVNENLSNKKLLKHIAIHPNISPDTLKKLMDYCPLQVINNPIIKLILLESPNLFDNLTHLPKKFFNNKKIPLWFFEFAANHPNHNIRASVALGLRTPLNLLEKLSQDQELKVRNYVYWNDNTPNSIIEKLKQETIQYAPFKNY